MLTSIYLQVEVGFMKVFFLLYIEKKTIVGTYFQAWP